jgi:hypothetical protein
MSARPELPGRIKNGSDLVHSKGAHGSFPIWPLAREQRTNLDWIPPPTYNHQRTRLADTSAGLLTSRLVPPGRQTRESRF